MRQNRGVDVTARSLLQRELLHDDLREELEQLLFSLKPVPVAAKPSVKTIDSHSLLVDWSTCAEPHFYNVKYRLTMGQFYFVGSAKEHHSFLFIFTRRWIPCL